MSPTAARRKATRGNAAPEQRIEVRKTYKLYIGGAFPRSESGRTYEIRAAGPSGRFLANAAMGSRKDARDAVVAARGAFAKWAGATAYNRGQVLYRVAELMEGRRAQFAAEVAAAEGFTPDRSEQGRLTGHRPLGLVCRVVGQARPGPGWGQPGRRAVLQHLRARAHRSGGRPCTATLFAVGSGLCARADRGQRQHRGGPDQ